MFDWLFEGRQSVYLILAALGVIVAALWARSGFVFFTEPVQRSKARETPKPRLSWMPLVLGVVVLLGLGYFLLDRLVETRSEQITRKLHEMADAVKRKDVERIFSHISDQFRFRTLGKPAFREFVDLMIRQGWVDELIVWDVEFPDDSGKVHFRAKPKGSRLPEIPFVRVRGEFVRDPDGQWRLKTFEVFGPVSDSDQPMPIPTLP